MTILHARKMLDALAEAGIRLERDPNWTEEEWANYIVHQFDISMLNTNKKDFAEESRELGKNTSRRPNTPYTSSGKFK